MTQKFGLNNWVRCRNSGAGVCVGLAGGNGSSTIKFQAFQV